ncbi:MAG: serine/threonine protein kinase [Desulfobacterales bacterium]|nr:serine/threonine protein kinase [Desulfobacterales bacterium]
MKTTQWQIGDIMPDADINQERWEIHRILGGFGKSGMGIVYIVYDHKWHVVFAAKTFQDEVFKQNPQIAEHFIQEAHAWINLDIHQNITRMHFFHRIKDKPFLFMEYVSRTDSRADLSKWIGTPRLTEDLPQVLHFGIQFCDGMSHALSKGIKAHRDIKPENCLITEDGTLKVTDFGLAKVFDDISMGDWKKEDKNEEKRGGILAALLGRNRTHRKGAGTPPYMSPEQFKDVKPDVRSDIYSFGVMLFEMITGQLPFSVPKYSSLSQKWKEFKYLHETQPPPSLPCQVSIISDIVNTCLAKDPTQRFTDFGEIRKQLTEIYEKITYKQAPQPMTGPELDADQLSNKIVSLNDLGYHEEALILNDHALETDALTHRALFNKGNTFVALRRYEEAFVCFEHVIEINPHDNRAWINKGNVLDELGRHAKAISCYDHVLKINPHNDIAWEGKGTTLDSQGYYQEAIKCYDCAIQINPLYYSVWYSKGTTLNKLEQFEQALGCFDRTLKMNPNYAKAWHNKGTALFGLERYEKALLCYERCFKIKSRDDYDMRYDMAWNSKGITFAKLGYHPEESIKCYDSAIEINPKYDEALYNKGVALYKLERYEEAIIFFSRTVEINPQYGEAWFNKGALLLNLGQIHDALMCFEKAHQLGMPTEQMIAMCHQMLGK